MVYKYFDKETSGGSAKTKLYLIKNQVRNYKIQLLENLKKVHSPFIGNIWGKDLADMQFISKLDKGFRFLLCIIGVYK